MRRGLSIVGALVSAALLSPIAAETPMVDRVASSATLEGLDCIVNPSRVVELGAPVAGLLMEAPYDRSDRVSRGEVMARLDSRVEEVAWVMAKLAVDHESTRELRRVAADFGERTVTRNESLTGDVALAAQAMDELRTESALASLRLREAEENHELALLERERAHAELMRRRLVSPIDGVVTERYRTEGEFIDGDAVYQLAQLDPLHVEVIVPMEYFGALSVDQAARLVLDAPGYVDRGLEAQIDRIDAVADAASATFGVRLELPNPHGAIPGGLRCTVDFLAD